MRFVLTAVVVTLCACSRSPRTDAGADAQKGSETDAQKGSGARPAPRPRDAQSDTGGGMAMTDAAAPGPGWVPLPGLPDGCTIERAEHPEALLSVTWEPCNLSVPGCFVLVDDREALTRSAPSQGWNDGSVGYFVEVHRDAADYRVVVLAQTNGPVVGAWRDPAGQDSGVCSVGDFGWGDGHAAFELKAWPDTSGPLESRIYHASLADIGRTTEPLAVLDESFTLGSTIQNLAVSSTTVAADLAPGGFIAVAERGKLVRLDGELPASASSPLAIIDGDVLFESWHPTTLHVMRGSARKPAELYFGPPDTNLRHFVSDGADMAWLQVYGMESASGPYERAEIWTADYAQAPADMEPRNLAEVEPRVRGMIGGGVYALGAPGPDGELWLEFYDLADGRRRVLRPSPSEMRLRQLLYVSAGEFLVTAVVDGEVRALRIDPTAVPYE